MQISGSSNTGRGSQPSIKVNLKYVLVGAAALIVLILLINVTAVVPAGSRGVLTTFGSVDEVVLEEGIHFINPMSKVTDLNVQTQLFEEATSASSDDLQSVSTNVAVNYHAEPSTAWKLYQEVGLAPSLWEARLLRPAVQESVKAVTARFTAENLIKERPIVKGAITDMIVERMATVGLVVEQVSITDFNFSKVFDDAIEAKVKEEQEAQKAENQLKRIKIEQEQKIAIATADKERAILEAEGEAKQIELQAIAEAEAHKIIAAAVTPESLRARTIERWDGVLPKVVGTNSNLLVNLGLEEKPDTKR